MDYITKFPLLVDGHSGCLHYLTIMHRIAMNIYDHVFFLQNDASFRYIHRVKFSPLMYEDSIFSTSLPMFATFPFLKMTLILLSV